MFVQGDKFRHGDELIWTHGNGKTEQVWFIEYSGAIVAVSTNPSVSPNQPEPVVFPNKPEPLAVVTRAVRKEMTVPVSELSRPE